MSTAIAAWLANAWSREISSSLKPPGSRRVNPITPMTTSLRFIGNASRLLRPLDRKRVSGYRSTGTSSQSRMCTMRPVSTASLTGFEVRSTGTVSANGSLHPPLREGCDGAQRSSVAFTQEQPSGSALAEAVGVVRDRLEHGLQVGAGRAHGVEHVGHRALSVERVVEIVEQAGVGDRDRRLIGERLEHRGEPGIERPNGAAADEQVADPGAFVEEGDRCPATDVRELVRQFWGELVEVVDGDDLASRCRGGRVHVAFVSRELHADAHTCADTARGSRQGGAPPRQRA